MPHEIFTSDEIKKLTSDMEARLNELAKGGKNAHIKWIHNDHQPMAMPEKELTQVEKAAAGAGETPESFWKKFKKAAHEDLCEEGGVLNKQWKRYGDLSNERVLKQFGAILVAMGFSGNVLQVVALACGVAVVHVGVKAYCMDAGDGEKDGGK